MVNRHYFNKISNTSLSKKLSVAQTAVPFLIPMACFIFRPTLENAEKWHPLIVVLKTTMKLARLRNHKATDDGKVDFRSFKKISALKAWKINVKWRIH